MKAKICTLNIFSFLFFIFILFVIYSCIEPTNNDNNNKDYIALFEDTEPAWSPDGKWIAYTSQKPRDGRLWKMRKDGSDKIPITPHAPEDYFENDKNL